MKHLRRRSAVALGIVIGLVAFAGGSALGLVGPFTDVPDNSAHAGNILAIREAGITAGCTVPNTPPGTTYCPSDFVRRDQMASFLGRLGGLQSATAKNVPRVNGKSDLSTYCALADSMRGTFDRGPCYGFDAKILDVAGGEVSIAVAADGNPIVAYFHGGDADLKVTHCRSVRCDTVTTSTLDSTGITGRQPSIMVGQDGLPVISYYDATMSALKVVACDSPDCSNFGTPFVIDNAGAVGEFSSITLGAEGMPIISYYDADQTAIKFVYCTSEDCSTRGVRVIEADGDVGKYTSIAQSRGGRPAMTYLDEGNGELRIATCGDQTCEPSLLTIETPDADGVGSYTSLVMGVDGNPVISYRDDVNDRLKIAVCANPACSTATLRFPTSGRDLDDGYQTSIAIGHNGLPVVSHVSGPANRLSVLQCVDVTCSAAESIGGVTNVVVPTLPTAVTIGVDGAPIVAYMDVTLNDVRVFWPRLLDLDQPF